MAGTPKTLRALSMPMTSAASDTSRMNGYITRVSVTVRAAFAGSKPGASVATSQGAERMPSTVIRLKTIAVMVAILLARRQAEDSSPAAAVFANTVTKAVD